MHSQSEMTYDPAKHHRRSIRLPAYDYAGPGTYFVTIVTYHRKCAFGEIAAGQMRVTEIGAMVREEWLRSAEIRLEIALDEYVIMPNHVHGIVIIRDVGAHGHAPLPMRTRQRPARSLGSFVAGYKAAATRRINVIRGTPGHPVWQRNYYERVIRGDAELNRIRQYIADNPASWEEDIENPAVVGAHGRAPLHGSSGAP